MKIGYVRVSTEEQNTARQEIMLRELGVDELFVDRASGKNADRPELNRMMNFVRRGDTVIVESIMGTLPDFRPEPAEGGGRGFYQDVAGGMEGRYLGNQ